MKRRNLFVFPVIIVFVLLVGLACKATSGQGQEPTSAPPPTQAQEQKQPTPQPPQNDNAQPPSNSNSNGSSSSDWTTFTDQSNLYSIQVPSDWAYKQVTGDNYYIDQFKSPDEKALVENITYDDGTPFTGSQNGRFALDLLNRFYSNTGATGDIRVSDDSIMKDGSERLTWRSRSGGYSGISFFEIRNKTTFLMITIEWMDDYESQYFDLLEQIVESYSLP